MGRRGHRGSRVSRWSCLEGLLRVGNAECLRSIPVTMLTHWLCIDATREDEVTVCFLGGWELVVWGDSVAELVHRGTFIALLPIGTA